MLQHIVKLFSKQDKFVQPLIIPTILDPPDLIIPQITHAQMHPKEVRCRLHAHMYKRARACVRACTNNQARMQACKQTCNQFEKGKAEWVVVEI